MTAMTVNSFPSLNNWNSPRAWALAIIVLLHVGFFWALTSGMGQAMLTRFVPLPPTLVPLTEPKVIEKPLVIDDPVIQQKQDDITVVKPEVPVVEETVGPETIFRETPTTLDQDIIGPGRAVEPIPTLVEPRIDARRGLSEPYFPPDVIRKGGEGTVLLSLYILADGRVGEVKLISSSGHTKLDESAMREAKKWRFIPGTSDGQPMAMWKQIPVTFRLNTRM